MAAATRVHNWTISSPHSHNLRVTLIVLLIFTIEELGKLIKHNNIVNYIKAQRLGWFGHVQRMSDTGTLKKIFNWQPLTKRSQGRPKYRWEDNIKQDICQTNLKNWIACFQNRGKWKEVAEKANSQPLKKVQRLEEKKDIHHQCLGLLNGLFISVFHDNFVRIFN